MDASQGVGQEVSLALVQRPWLSGIKGISVGSHTSAALCLAASAPGGGKSPLRMPSVEAGVFENQVDASSGEVLVR